MRRDLPVVHLSIMLVILMIPFGAFADGLDKCRTLLESGRLTEAGDYLANYRRTHPDDPRGLLLLARLETDMEKALALYREAELLAVSGTADTSTVNEALHHQAEIHFAADDMNRAAAISERIVTTYPTGVRYVDAVYRLGIINLVNGEPKRAVEKFRLCRTIALNPGQRTKSAVGLMEAYVALPSWPDALAAARDVLDETDEGSAVTPRILEVMATAWRELGNAENEKWYTDRLLNDYPDSYQAYAVREQGKRMTAGLSLPDTETDSGETIEYSEDMASMDVDREATDIVSDTDDNSEPTSGPSFSVQAGAFSGRMNARKLYERLISSGHDARVELKNVGERHFYIVFVGRYTSREQAEQDAGKVAKTTGERANVVMIKE